MPLTKKSRAWLVRMSFGALGAAALLLGVIGIFLPLLPTTPFVLLAAACFAKASPRIEAYLLNHKTFGPAIRDWRDRRAVSKKGKIAACVGMAVGFGFFLVLSDPEAWLIGVVFVCFLCIAAYMVSRPT